MQKLIKNLVGSEICRIQFHFYKVNVFSKLLTACFIDKVIKGYIIPMVYQLNVTSIYRYSQKHIEYRDKNMIKKIHWPHILLSFLKGKKYEMF